MKWLICVFYNVSIKLGNNRDAFAIFLEECTAPASLPATSFESCYFMAVVETTLVAEAHGMFDALLA